MIPTDSLTDLIGGVILLPAIAVLSLTPSCRRTEKRRWICFFSLLAASCITGFTAHYCLEPRYDNSFTLIWLLLYPLLTQTVNAFFFLALDIKSGGSLPVKSTVITVQCISSVFTAASMVLILAVEGTDLDIKLFTLYAAAVCIAGFSFIIPSAFAKRDSGSLLIISTLLPLAIGAYFQIERKTVIHIGTDFNFNAITHIFIIICEFVLFAAAIKRIKCK